MPASTAPTVILSRPGIQRDGTATIQNTGTSGANVPLMNGANTWSALQTFSSGIAFANETLSTYDEGTFTPTIAGSATAGTQTYSFQEGDYIKIGKFVWCSVAFLMTAKDAATNGNLRIPNLPFTIANTATGIPGALAVGNCKFDLAAAGNQVGGQVVGNTTRVDLYESADNADAVNLTNTSLVATSRLVSTVTYMAST